MAIEVKNDVLVKARMTRSILNLIDNLEKQNIGFNEELNTYRIHLEVLGYPYENVEIKRTEVKSLLSRLEQEINITSDLLKALNITNQALSSML